MSTYKKIGTKLLLRDVYGRPGKPLPTIAHWCEGCQSLHDFPCDVPFPNGHRWTWNNVVAAPTFVPSMNLSWGHQADPKCTAPGGRCHYNITKGEVQFHNDCTHALKGQKRPLLDVPDSALAWMIESL